MQISDIWLRDMPQQFQSKHNIEILIKAFSKQMQSVEDVFQDLNTMTDIDTAIGKNLDNVGNIVSLSRKDAGELAEINTDEFAITDERYRQLLRYKVLKNTNNCTYYDIISSLCLLWETDKPIYYTERKNRPAMVFIGIPKMPVDTEDPKLLRRLKIKAAGVGLVYVLQYTMQVFEYPERAVLRNIGFRINAMFWYDRYMYNDTWLLDGSWVFDATWLLDDNMAFDGTWLLDGSWVFDGTWLFDGSRMFDGTWKFGDVRVLDGIWMFEDGRVFDGTWMFNGDWVFDGTVAFNTKRRYDLVPRLKHALGFYVPERMRMVSIVFSGRIKNHEIFDVRVAGLFGINFFGTLYFDGLWDFDGSVALDERQRYDIALDVGNRIEIGNPMEEVRLRALYIAWEQHIHEIISVHTAFHFSCVFWKALYFDGEWLPDGKWLFNSNRCRAKAALMVYTALDMSGQEMVTNVIIETKTRDYWFLDGVLLSDGSRRFNSKYRKEKVE